MKRPERVMRPSHVRYLFEVISEATPIKAKIAARPPSATAKPKPCLSIAIPTSMPAMIAQIIAIKKYLFIVISNALDAHLLSIY